MSESLSRGLAAAILGGFLWGVYSFLSGVRLDWVPVVSVGFTTGLAVRGRDARGSQSWLGLRGALLTLLAGLIAESLSLWGAVVMQLGTLPHAPFAPAAMAAIYADFVRAQEVVAYSVAVWEGYHFAAHETWAQRLAASPDPQVRARWIGGLATLAAVLFFGLLTLNVYRAKIVGLAASRDGSRLALAVSGNEASMPRTLTVWEFPQRKRIELAQQRVGPLAWSHDAQRLAVESGPGTNSQPDPGRVSIWDLQTQTSALLKGHRDFVRCLAFSPVGDLLATGGQDGTVALWNAQARTLSATLDEESPVSSLAFSPSGATLAVGLRNGTLALWDVAGRQRLDSSPLHRAAVTGLVFSTRQNPPVLYSAGGVDATVRVWTLAPLAQQASYPQPMGWIAGCVLSPDERALAVFGGSFHRPGAVRLIAPQNGRLEREFVVPANTVVGAGFLDDGKILAAGTAAPVHPFTWRRHGELHLWDVATGEELPWPP